MVLHYKSQTQEKMEWPKSCTILLYKKPPMLISFHSTQKHQLGFLTSSFKSFFPPSYFKTISKIQKTKDNMISARKLVKMARKWQRIAALGRKRITFPRSNSEENTSSTSSSVAKKGHFVTYTTDQRRFVMPIAYLNNCIFQELLRMSEEEFGLSSEGPIILPCDSVFLEYVQSLIQRGLGSDIGKALLNSIASTSSSCSQSAASFLQSHTDQQLLVSGY